MELGGVINNFDANYIFNFCRKPEIFQPKSAKHLGFFSVFGCNFSPSDKNHKFARKAALFILSKTQFSIKNILR